MYRVYRLPGARDAERLLKDDLVSRQSIVVRDAGALEVPGGGTIVVVEGSEAALARAADLLADVGTRLEGAQAEAIHRKVRSEEDDAASGMGLLFGT